MSGMRALRHRLGDGRPAIPARPPRPRPVGDAARPARSDERTASWAIGRHFACTVEALDGGSFAHHFHATPMPRAILARFGFAYARLRLAPRARPSLVAALAGPIGLRMGDALVSLAPDAGVALFPAGQPIEIQIAGPERHFLLCEFEAEDLVQASLAVAGCADPGFVRERLARKRPWLAARPDSGAEPVLRQFTILAELGAENPAIGLFPEIQSGLMKTIARASLVATGEAGRAGTEPVDPRLRRLCARALDGLATGFGLADMAAASGLTARSVQLLFRRDLGTSPKQWLTEQRLLAVRARLCAPEPGDSVTSVAIPFFGNLGDFAQRYRDRFGEKPSETLARARAGN